MTYERKALRTLLSFLSANHDIICDVVYNGVKRIMDLI